MMQTTDNYRQNHMKTKVAIVLSFFGYGGAERMVSRLASHLDLDEVQAEVICVYGEPQNNEMEQAIIDHGVQIHYIHKGLGFSLGAIFRIYKELNRFSPDVVHTNLSGAIYSSLWILLHRARMLHTVHNMPTREFGKRKRMVMSILYRTGKAIPVAISDEIRQLMGKTYKRTLPVELVYNPVDVERFASIKKIPHDMFVIISVGRLEPQKNHKLLVDAFEIITREIPNSELFILGDGPLKDEVQEYIVSKKLEQKITLTGIVKNVEDYLASADIFVLSSDYEGLPLSILEAMAAGLPIVSTDVGGVKDIVTNNGILAKKGDADSLADAVIRIGKNRDLREQFSAMSTKNVKQFDSETIASEYIVLYKKYAGRKQR